MQMLIAAALTFLAIHLVVSGTRLRDWITDVIGENVYLGLFSLVSVGALVWLAMSFNAASAALGSSSDPILYAPGTAVRHLGPPLVLLAFLIGVPGLLTPNPTSVRQEGAAAKEGTVRGILRVTRHPFLWGVAIWSAFHLAANGDEAAVVLFGSLFLTAVLGTFSIDAKRKRKLGAAWEGFASKTSNIPFAAILAGRNSFKVGEYFDWRLLVAVLIFCVILVSHAHLFGVSPFPGGWRPF